VYGLDYPGFESQQKAPKGSNRPWGPLSLLYSGHRGSCLEVKRPRREVGHSFSYSVEIKNEWSYNSVPPCMCLHASHRVNSIFSTSFSRRTPRSGISNMHAGRQSILCGPLTDVIPITEFGPAQCQMLFVTAVRALNLRLSLGGNRGRRERVRVQVIPTDGIPPENQNICYIFGSPFWTRPSASNPPHRHWVVTYSMPGDMTMQ